MHYGVEKICHRYYWVASICCCCVFSLFKSTSVLSLKWPTSKILCPWSDLQVRSCVPEVTYKYGLVLSLLRPKSMSVLSLKWPTSKILCPLSDLQDSVSLKWRTNIVLCCPWSDLEVRSFVLEVTYKYGLVLSLKLPKSTSCVVLVMTLT